jgi:putative hydrolase of the HAD superfamily
MIKNIIFDFGDIFINLDKTVTKKGVEIAGIEKLPDNMLYTCLRYEEGKHSTEKFLHRFVDRFPQLTEEKFIKIWNSILLDFPIHRLVFLKELAKTKKYRLFLLSNTNELHISWIQENWGMELYNDFKNCFEQFYLSHEIKMRKPNAAIYEFVLNKNDLKAEETLFVDDTKENTDTAKLLGIKVWNLIPGKDDVTNLFNLKHFSN